MLNLIPTEHWDYGFAQTARGLHTAFAPRYSGTIQIPGLGACLPVRSGRAAIVLALKALELPVHATIGVPLYCCPVVLSAIKAAGCSARFIDVDPETYCLSLSDLAAKSAKVDAVIAVHMFGNVCDMHRLREAAPGKPFIEDCAQALGSRLDGHLVGSFSDVAVFSFRSGKYLSAGEGGAVYSRDASVEARLSKLINELPIPSRRDECVHVAITFLRSLLRTRPLWGMIGSRLWSAYAKNVSCTSQAPVVLGQIYQTDLKTALRRFASLASMIEKQRSNAEYYRRNLAVDPEMLCSETSGAFFNRLQFPLLLPTPEQCDRLSECLQNNRISIARPYKDITAIATAHYGYTGDCPQAERIARTVLVIPCNYAISDADRERIATCVNRTWAGIGHRRRGMLLSSIRRNALDSQQNEYCGSVDQPHHLL